MDKKRRPASARGRRKASDNAPAQGASGADGEAGREDGAGGASLVAFEIEHFKLFRHTRLDVHPETTVLVGANDVGKSVLLEAITRYGKIQRVGFRGLLSDKRFGGARGEPTRFTAEWDVDGRRWRHSITLDISAPEERLERGREYWSWNPKTRVLDTHRGRFDAPDIERYTPMARVEWALDTDLEKSIYEPLAVTRRFVTSSAYLFEPSGLGQPAPLDLRRPRRNGHGWANWLQEIINRRNVDLEEMEAAVRTLFPFFRRVRVTEKRLRIDVPVTTISPRLLETLRRRESRREVFLEIAAAAEAHVEADHAGGSPEPLLIAAADSSAGLLLALAHFSLVYADEAGRLILLEEPENGLNARITLDMMREFLRVVQRRHRQLILTSHNAWWLDLVPAESIRVVTRDAEGSQVEQPDPVRLKMLRDELGVYPSEIVSAHGPEALLADSIMDEDP